MLEPGIDASKSPSSAVGALDRDQKRAIHEANLERTTYAGQEAFRSLGPPGQDDDHEVGPFVVWKRRLFAPQSKSTDHMAACRGADVVLVQN